jgi:RimJ/RimL family protein N-acetyltransferase
MGMIQRHSGIVMGFSAGAMIQMAEYHITPDEDYESFGYFKGLGLIHSFDLEVHFKSTQVQLDCINRSIRETGRPVYAMEDEGALIVADGKVVTIGKVHYFNERRDHMFEIIKATLNHSDDLGYVHTISWQQAYQGIIPQMFLDQLTPEARAAFFKKAIPISKHEFYIAYLNGKPVGMMSIGKSRDKDLDDHAAEVSSIYCISDVWGKGYGRQFMDYAIDRLKDQSFRSVTLWVFEENQRARTFYEKYGYSFDGTKEQSDIGGKLLTEMRYVYTIV